MTCAMKHTLCLQCVNDDRGKSCMFAIFPGLWIAPNNEQQYKTAQICTFWRTLNAVFTRVYTYMCVVHARLVSPAKCHSLHVTVGIAERPQWRQNVFITVFVWKICFLPSPDRVQREAMCRSWQVPTVGPQNEKLRGLAYMCLELVWTHTYNKFKTFLSKCWSQHAEFMPQLHRATKCAFDMNNNNTKFLMKTISDNCCLEHVLLFLYCTRMASIQSESQI